MKMSSRQLEIVQHSLGCDKYGQGTRYRNRFVTGPPGDDFDDCKALCEMGLMKDFGPREMLGGMHYFQVTEAGIQEMEQQSPKPPKISRGRRRYLDFLHADSGMSFGEWLKVRQ